MRPIYETDNDRREQQDIADKVAWAFGRMVLFPELHRLDYYVERQGIRVAYAEIKRRYIPFDNPYPDIILSLGKVEAAREISRSEGLPCYFIVGFDCDYIACADMLPERRVTRGGRYDRGDPHDVELVVRIPKSDFTRIEIRYVWTQAELDLR